MMHFTSTRDDYIEDDPTWNVHEIQPALAPDTPMPEATRRARIEQMVTAATLDESYAALWVAEGIDVYEARHRVARLLRT